MTVLGLVLEGSGSACSGKGAMGMANAHKVKRFFECVRVKNPRFDDMWNYFENI